MSVECQMTISHGGTVLCAAGGWLAEHPAIELEQAIVEAAGPMTTAAFLRALGGVTARVTLAIEQDAASAAAARAAFLMPGMGTAHIPGTSGTLFLGGTAFPYAVMDEAGAELPSGTGAATVVRSLTFTAGPPW